MLLMTIIKVKKVKMRKNIVMMMRMCGRCEWIRSERFAKKQKEEAKNREKNNPMKAGRKFLSTLSHLHCKKSEDYIPALKHI